MGGGLKVKVGVPKVKVGVKGKASAKGKAKASGKGGLKVKAKVGVPKVGAKVKVGVKAKASTKKRSLQSANTSGQASMALNSTGISTKNDAKFPSADSSFQGDGQGELASNLLKVVFTLSLALLVFFN